jgi:hypothetical protein
MIQHDGFDYFTMRISPDGQGPITLKTEPGPSESRIRIDSDKAAVEVDYAHRPVYVVRRNREVILTNKQSVVRGATQGLRPNIELVKRFVKNGPAMDLNVPYHGVECVAPSSRIVVSGTEISTQRYQTEPPGEPLVGMEAVERALVESIAKRIKNKKCAFALSGGTDSTLLTALATRHQLCDVTAYTAKTGAGLDLDFARAAAQSLGIKLVEVEIPVTERQLEIHRAYTDAACGPVKTKVGFTMVCMAAQADGFEAIVDGTGSAQIFAGNDEIYGACWAAEQLRSGDRERAEKYIEFALQNQIIKRATVAKLRERAKEEVSFRGFMFEALTRKVVRVFQHVRNASGTMLGMDVVMPFFDHDVCRYLLNDSSEFFRDHHNKCALKEILAKYVPREVAHRVDNQGLRWSTARLISRLGSEMSEEIRGSELLRHMSAIDRMKIFAKFDKQLFSRFYAASLFLDMKRQQSPYSVAV